MRNILIENLKGPTVSERDAEIVERKGTGHPDYMCDAIMEEVSLSLNREYLKRWGAIFHYNIDKGLLAAGRVERKFGGGRVLEPMRLIFGDRATTEIKGEHLPVDEIAVTTAKEWLKRNLRFLNPEENVVYQVEIKPGSSELTDIFYRRKGPLPANDTSAAVGYAPLTETEKMVLEMERYLNSPSFKEIFPETGEDIKVMGFREKRRLYLTIAMPMLDRFVEREDYYFKRKEEIEKSIKEHANSKKESIEEIEVYLNTLDEPGRGLGGMYLTVLGTSAEDGDSGEVGRGNRVNGVIALSRPMGTEAAAGKNPVSHVGKIYNLLSHKIAEKIYHDVPGIKEVYIWLCSQIGTPIDMPKIAAAQVILKPKIRFSSVAKRVKEIIDIELSDINKFCNELIQGKYPVC